MRHEIIMPALGMAQKTGIIVAWHKAEGDAVKASDILLDVETDKSTMEVEAGYDGYVASLMAKAGEHVPVGDTIAIISTEKPEATTSGVGETELAPPTVAPASAVILSVKPVSPKAFLATPTPRSAAKSFAAPIMYGRILASPKAKRVAAERGVDLARLVDLNFPQPFHVADIDAIPRAEPAASVTALPSEIDASVDPAGLPGMLDLLRKEGGGAGSPALWAAFAASSLRASLDVQKDISVQVEQGGKILRYRNPDWMPLSRLEPDPHESEVDVIVRDLTDTCLVSTRIAGEAAPVLTLVDYGGKANLRLAFDSLLMPPSAGAAFVIGFAARMRDPLRQLL